METSRQSGRDCPTIGVLAGWQVYEGTILQSFFSSLLRGVRTAAEERGCNLLLACGIGLPITGEDRFSPAWLAPAPGVDFVPVGPWNTDGLLVVTPLLSPERSRAIRRIAGAGHPVVYCGGGEGRPMVRPDAEEGFCQALAHLIRHGHRRIALIVRDDVREETQRQWRSTYESAMGELGVAVDPALVVTGHSSAESGRRALRGIVRSGSPFTAVLVCSDEMAVGATEALGEAGLRVPGDVAVVGIGDVLAVAALDPPLTTVHTGSFEFGYRALELALDHVAGRTTGDEMLSLPPRLVVRESCGCPADQLAGERGLPAAYPEGDGSASTLAQRMAASVAPAAEHLGADEVLALCERLAASFASSLEPSSSSGKGLQDRGEGFRPALREVLRRVEAAGDDPHAWQAAISTLSGWSKTTSCI